MIKKNVSLSHSFARIAKKWTKLPPPPSVAPPDARTRRGAFSPSSFPLSFFFHARAALSALFLLLLLRRRRQRTEISRVLGAEKGNTGKERVDSPRKKKEDHSLSPKGDLEEDNSRTRMHFTDALLFCISRIVAQKNTSNRRYLRSRKTWRSSPNAPRGKTGRF